MRRGDELTLQFGSSQPQRLERPYALGVARRFRLRLFPFALELFHALLNTRIRIDQALAGIAHVVSHEARTTVERAHRIMNVASPIGERPCAAMKQRSL